MFGDSDRPRVTRAPGEIQYSAWKRFRTYAFNLAVNKGYGEKRPHHFPQCVRQAAKCQSPWRAKVGNSLIQITGGYRSG